MNESVPVIELEHVVKSFGDNVILNDVSLRIERGEVVVILGPSGSGKSTLLRTLNRLEPISSGTIRIAGTPLPHDPASLARVRATVGMVFQSFNLFPGQTALENVAFGPSRVRGLAPQAARELSMRLLERVGLAEHADKLATQLSGGQQQRVAIARALAMEPQVLLFDEPTSALDPEMVDEVLRVITELAHERRTMIIVTHELAFAQRVANRILLLDGGSIIEDQPPEQFFTHPTTQRGRDFVALLRGSVEKEGLAGQLGRA